ncbi:hypothetical protein ACGF0D_39345 [Kitasatospora sp. NPDC048298]|uniref:hypothetical protein n=1 Tax=Kitasatospora sp. NPDC048298 TaxID=3364049 RepID=UPI0037177F46
MPVSLPGKPDLSDADVVLLQQVARGALYEATNRATGSGEAKVGVAVHAPVARVGAKSRSTPPHRARAGSR